MRTRRSWTNSGCYSTVNNQTIRPIITTYRRRAKVGASSDSRSYYSSTGSESSMAANVLETVSEELGTTGVIESRHSIMGNKGILLYEFSQNFKPEHIYNIAFEYVSERIAECNVSGNEQTDEKNNELRHIFVELGMVDSYLDCSPETVQYRQDSEITEKYRISGNAEMPLCWQK